MRITKVCLFVAGVGAAAVGEGSDAIDRMAEHTERARLEIEYLQTQRELEEARRQLEAAKVGPLPRLISIYGKAGDLSAQVIASSGASWQVSAGDIYTPGWRVVEVMEDRVIVVPERGGAKHQIGLGDARPILLGSGGRR